MPYSRIVHGDTMANKIRHHSNIASYLTVVKQLTITAIMSGPAGLSQMFPETLPMCVVYIRRCVDLLATAREMHRLQAEKLRRSPSRNGGTEEYARLKTQHEETAQIIAQYDQMRMIAIQHIHQTWPHSQQMWLG